MQQLPGRITRSAGTRARTRAHTVPQSLFPFAAVASTGPVRTALPVWVLRTEDLEQGPLLTGREPGAWSQKHMLSFKTLKSGLFITVSEPTHPG